MSVFTKKLSGASPAAAVLLAAFAALVVFAVFAAGILSSCGGGGGGGWNGPLKWTVSFEPNGGSPAPGNQSIADDGTVTPPSSMSKAGYAFGGWYSDSALSTPWIWTNPVNFSMRLYAKWVDTEGKLVVSFETGGGAPALNDELVASGQKITGPVTTTTITKPGYDFGGWYKEDTFATVWDFDTDTVSAGMTLYAKWGVKTYAIAYTLYGGTNPGSPPATYTIESADITLPIPTRTNHIFEGWYTDAGFTGAAVTKIPAGSTGDKAFHAKWRAAVKFTNIASVYNGQYAVFRSSESTPPTGDAYLIGAGGFAGSNLTGVQISGGSVTIPVYLGNTTGGGTINGPYSGNNPDITIYLIIKETRDFAGTSDLDNRGTYTIPGVDFAGGAAAVNIATATVPKTLEITSSVGEPAAGKHVVIGVFETGTPDEDLLDVLTHLLTQAPITEHELRKKGFVAGSISSRLGDMTFASGGPGTYIITAGLYVSGIPPYGGLKVAWTGSGAYNVYLIDANGANPPPIDFKPNVSFPAGTPPNEETVSISFVP
ncbi:MAG: InlB B-repeat-containing protein [Treponema sp.]|jgi:uncharacterized repeat protein (TIGR02543 family)|nr:InlB B-repeat-containing protein [Treponema sp.]